MFEPQTVRIFLLRGLARESRHWGKFVKVLETKGKNIVVIPLEIPGTGELRQYNSPLSMKEYLHFLRIQYKPRTHPGDIHIVLGLSFGGMLAAEWIARHPGDFHGAVIINSSGRQSLPHKRLRPSALLSLCKCFLLPQTQKRETIIASLVCNMANTKEIAGQWTEISRTAPISGINILRQLLSAMLFSFPKRLQPPLLLLGSRKDRMVSFSCTQKIGTQLGITPVFHNSGGHDLTTDDPQWCAEIIHTWLKYL